RLSYYDHYQRLVKWPPDFSLHSDTAEDLRLIRGGLGTVRARLVGHGHHRITGQRPVDEDHLGAVAVGHEDRHWHRVSTPGYQPHLVDAAAARLRQSTKVDQCQAIRLEVDHRRLGTRHPLMAG